MLEDADLAGAVDAAYISRMANNAQACINAKRFIVQSSVYDEFKDRLIEKIKSATVMGDQEDKATNLGPLVHVGARDNLRDQVERALTEGGARLAHGTHKFTMPDKDLEDGAWFEPVVVEGMNPDSKVYREELFGPVFPLFKVDSPDEAVDLANKTDYGLSAAVWTEDPEKAESAA